jgi:hypothetical protein
LRPVIATPGALERRPEGGLRVLYHSARADGLGTLDRR